mmetsp:Transcript_3018/g.2497  ORF Transcript_3018/g.2497 Transcript_3018/m.2497 type:complete len:198 (+) Transcript_3018:342-935(+)
MENQGYKRKYSPGEGLNSTLKRLKRTIKNRSAERVKSKDFQRNKFSIINFRKIMKTRFKHHILISSNEYNEKSLMPLSKLSDVKNKIDHYKTKLKIHTDKSKRNRAQTVIKSRDQEFSKTYDSRDLNENKNILDEIHKELVRKVIHAEKNEQKEEYNFINQVKESQFYPKNLTDALNEGLGLGWSKLPDRDSKRAKS